MKVTIRAARTQEARDTAQQAADRLAEIFDLHDHAAALAAVSDRDKDVEQLRQWQATASLLDAVANAAKGAAIANAAHAMPLPEILQTVEAVEGVGPKTLAAIRDHLERHAAASAEGEDTQGEDTQGEDA